MKVILPIDLHPHIESSLEEALCLSSMQAYFKNAHEWLCCQFLNLSYDKNRVIRFGFVQNNPWFIKQKIFDVQKMLLSKDILDFSSFDLWRVIINALNVGVYITCELNPYYIYELHEYRKIQRKKKILLYGADFCKQRLYIFCRENAGNLVEIDVSFEEFREAISCIEDGILPLMFYIPNTNKELGFDPIAFCENLEDYYRSSNTLLRPQDSKEIYGIKAIEAFRKECTERGEDSSFVEWRSLQALCEHKILMQVGWNIIKREFSTSNMTIEKLIQKNIENCDRAKRFGEQYNKTHSYDCLGALDNDLKEIISIEEEICGKMLRILDKKIK